MYHARSGDSVACGEQPTPLTILIWTDDLADVTCCDCIRALGLAPADIHPSRYGRAYSWAGVR